MFQLQSASSAVTAVDVGLNKQVDNMSESLDSEILKGAKALLDSLTKAIQPSQKNVNSLKQLREKVEGLAFLNGKYSNLVRKIRQVEEAMPLVGKLANDDIDKLSGLLYRMSDESKLTILMSNLQQEPQQPAPVTQTVTQPEVETAPEAQGITFDFGGETPTSSETQDDYDFSDFDFGDIPPLSGNEANQDDGLSWNF
jgi:hypothetical protein